MSKIIEIKFSIDLDNSEDTEFLKDFLALKENKIFPKKEIAEIKHSLDAEMPKQEDQKEPISKDPNVFHQESKSIYTKTQLQELLAKKNNINTKPILKEKLNELGATNISTLSEEHYNAFYSFMDSL